MSRDIKFRAWDDYSKEWLLGYEYPNLGGFSMYGECMLFEEWSNILNRFVLQQNDRKPEHLKLMQYTGLKDKNGKDIYEGDLVNCNRYENEENYIVEIKDIRYLPSELSGSNLNWKEVIGNVYQNNELLTPKN